MAIIVKMGHVEETSTDPAGGLRIKARTKQDGSGNVPWAFPLLPKQFQVVPKVGEGVFIFTEDDTRKDSNRYYVGPIISQPQYNDKCDFSYGRGNALSCLQGRVIEPLPNIANDSRTNGSFPNIGDVSVVGRDSQDVIMKKNKTDADEIDIRCGIRKADTLQGQTNDAIQTIGKIIFNDVDPAYIQLKYKPNLGSAVEDYNAELGTRTTTVSKTNSVINVVADKINLVGVSDDTINAGKTDNDTLIKDEDIDKLMSELHQLPKGDVLVKLLKLLRDALLTHTHNYNGLKPTVSNYVLSLTKFNLNSILSSVVRIS